MQNVDAQGTAHYPGWTMEALKYLYEVRHITASGHETTDTDPGLATTKDDYSLENYILGIEGVGEIDPFLLMKHRGDAPETVGRRRHRHQHQHGRQDHTRYHAHSFLLQASHVLLQEFPHHLHVLLILFHVRHVRAVLEHDELGVW